MSIVQQTIMVPGISNSLNNALYLIGVGVFTLVLLFFFLLSLLPDPRNEDDKMLLRVIYVVLLVLACLSLPLYYIASWLGSVVVLALFLSFMWVILKVFKHVCFGLWFAFINPILSKSFKPK